jgi:hypothetical protein
MSDKYSVSVDDMFPVWWHTGQKDSEGNHMARVIAIEPYRGVYQDWFDTVLTLTAPETRNGALQMTYDTRTGPLFGRICRK